MFWNYVICDHPTIQNLVLHRLIENPKLCTYYVQKKIVPGPVWKVLGFGVLMLGFRPPPQKKKIYILDRMSSVVEPEPDFFAGAGVGASG